MKKYLTIIAIIICGFANAQTGYLVQPAKWKFIRPQWLDSGMWIKNIPKYGGQNRVLVYDSISNKVGYKYISNGATYTAGRGLTLNSNVFRLDTTQGYTWTNTKTNFNGTPIATPNYGVINFGNGGFSGGANHFTGSSLGTVLAANAASGFAGDLMNLQVAGNQKFSISNTGIITNPGFSLSTTTLTFKNTNSSNITMYPSNDGDRAYVNGGVGVALNGTYLLGSAGTIFTVGSGGWSNTSGTDQTLRVNGGTFGAGAGSASFQPLAVTYTLNNSGAQSGIATGIFLNATETALNSMTHNLMDLQVGGTSKFKVDNIGNVTAKNGKLSGVLFSQTSTATVANTTTETTVTSTGIGSLTLPANFFEVGTTIVIHAEGFHSAIANPDITVKIKLGGTTYITTGTVTSGNSTDAYCEIKGTITCRTTGASGTVFAQGFYVETGAGDLPYGMPNTTTQTIDTTSAQTVDVTVQWGTASASNTISITNLLIEGKN